MCNALLKSVMSEEHFMAEVIWAPQKASRSIMTGHDLKA